VRIVLLGATGFVGSALLAEALHRGHKVTAIVIEAAHAAGETGCRRQDLLGGGHRLRRRTGGVECAGGAIEQPQAEDVLELLELQAHRRLRQPELGGRAGEISRAVHLDKDLQLPDRQIHEIY
jgi:nucleoside-diphosphate-sugar epimerase